MSINGKQHKKVLLVANVVKEHVLKFHVPTIRLMRERGWTVDVAASGEEEVPCCSRQIHGVWKRSPFTPDTLKGILQLRREIDQGDYDIVYCHTPVGALVARLAAMKARKHGTKVVYFAHGFHFFKGAPLINWLVFYPVEKILARYTDLLITLNDEDCDLVKRRFGESLCVIQVPGAGVDFSRLHVEKREETRRHIRQELGIAEQALTLIYIAELIPNKNQKMLLEAIKEIRKTNPQAVLLLVGPDHTNGQMQETAHQMELDEAVVFAGWRRDIGALLCSADIAVASSIREGFGLNLIEAMYMGLPVVATDNRGHRMIIRDGENGFLVRVGDSRKMAERILEIVTSPDLRMRFGQVDVRRFGADIVSEQIVDILERI